MTLKVSLIVTTYNWPEALRAVLNSVTMQSELPYEVIVADDGSRVETSEMIAEIQKSFPCPLHHVWHEDNGYQGSKIRNKAVALSTGDYLVFIDGDCLLRQDFISRHKALAADGYFVAGNRILLTQQFTYSVLQESRNINTWDPYSFTSEQVNRRWSLLHIPLGIFRKFRVSRWQGVKTCNMSLWKKDFIQIDGFDEQFQGWGYEDSDLTVRLIRLGIKRLSGRFAVTVLHLWHPTSKGVSKQGNWDKLQETISGTRLTAVQGISHHG
jgi:glycosyltransferase involved in cell wall biosynthesis